MALNKSKNEIIIITFSVFLSLLVSYYLLNQENNRFKITFETHSKKLSALILKGLQQNDIVLSSFEALLLSAENINRQSFHTYANTLIENQPGLVAVDWLPKLSKSNEATLLTQAKLEHHNFGLKELSIDGSYIAKKENSEFSFPVLYSESSIESPSRIGFDWSTMDNRSESLNNALVKGSEFAFLGNVEKFPIATNSLIRPIFNSNIQENSMGNLIGFIVLHINAKELLDQALSSVKNEDLGVVIYEKVFEDNEAIFRPIYSDDKLSMDELDYHLIKEKQKISSEDSLNWAAKSLVMLSYPSKLYQDHINYFPTFSTFIFINLLVIFFLNYRNANNRRKDLIEKEVDKRTLQLKRSNDELISFANIVSHDLKEPIRGIANYSSFLAKDYEDKLDEKGLKMLETIKELCKKSTSLASSLLEYSRVDKLEFAKQEANLNEVLKDVLFSIELFLEENNAKVIIKKELPALNCDKIKIGEVFRNLITNGVKYNDQPEKIIEIDYCYNDDGACIISVRDNGKGILEEFHEKIFQIFTRLEDSSSEGTGLGLSLVKKIINKHDGAIWLESFLNRGTTFFFSLQELSDEFLKTVGNKNA